MSNGSTPADVISENDPGDETSRRYVYQWTYTASVACGLLEVESGLDEVYCEHHEDLLIKREDGTFHAIQVKTRQLGTNPWKFSDDDILKALARFARHERRFPGAFSRYTIATNHQFFEAQKTGANLPYLLELIRDITDESTMGNQLRSAVKKVASKSSCSTSIVLDMLKKTECNHHLPKLDNIKSALCDSIRQSYPESGDSPYPALYIAADALVSEVQRASSLDHRQAVPLYLGVIPRALEESEKALIDGKRLTRDRIQRVLCEAFNSPSLLVPPCPGKPHPLAKGRTRLEKKLNAGGLSAMMVDSAKDLQYASLIQAQKWLAKYGTSKGLEIYNHIRTLVKLDCAACYDAVESSAELFGKSMFVNLRARLQERCSIPGAPLCGCEVEHLLGHAFMLTDDCKVWWSLKFVIAGD